MRHSLYRKQSNPATIPTSVYPHKDLTSWVIQACLAITITLCLLGEIQASVAIRSGPTVIFSGLVPSSVVGIWDLIPDYPAILSDQTVVCSEVDPELLVTRLLAVVLCFSQWVSMTCIRICLEWAVTQCSLLINRDEVGLAASAVVQTLEDQVAWEALFDFINQILKYIKMKRNRSTTFEISHFFEAKRQKVEGSGEIIEKCPHLSQIAKYLLDFDQQKQCSVSLTTMNVYCCLVCGK